VHLTTVLLGNLVALLNLFVAANLAGDGAALLPGNGGALLLGNLVAHRVADRFGPGLRNVTARLVRVGLAAAGDWNPDFGAALCLPLVLTVVLVLCCTVSFCYSFILGFCTLCTYIPVDSGAPLILDSAAFLLGNIVASWTGDGGAGVDKYLLTLLLLSLPVLRGEHRHVLRPAVGAPS